MVIPQPWRWMFRVFGIAPVGNRKDSYITGIVFAMMFVYFGVVICFNQHVLQTFNVLSITIGTFYYSALFLFLAHDYLYPQKYKAIETDLRGIDRDLKALTKDKIIAASVSPVIVFWAVFFGLLLLGAFSFKSQFLFVAAIWLNHLILYTPMLQQVLLVNVVHHRFVVLNDVLSATVVGPDTPALLDQVFRVYFSLHALVADIDLRYCFYNLFRFAGMFLIWVRSMHGILLFISGDDDDNAMFYINQYRVFLVTSLFLLQTLTCHSCSRTAGRTVLIAHRLLQPDTDLSIWDQVRMFSALVTDNKVHYTMGGIFTLDRTLVTKTALAALSYLVIAVQLKDVKVFGGGEEVTNRTTVSPSTTM